MQEDQEIDTKIKMRTTEHGNRPVAPNPSVRRTHLHISFIKCGGVVFAYKVPS